MTLTPSNSVRWTVSDLEGLPENSDRLIADNAAKVVEEVHTKTATDFIRQAEAVSRKERGRSPVVLGLR
jgi:hypothetical protein